MVMFPLKLRSYQFKVLSDFCSDFAKGLALAVVIGQGFAGEVRGLERASFSLIWIMFACLFLYFAIYLAQGVKS